MQATNDTERGLLGNVGHIVIKHPIRYGAAACGTALLMLAFPGPTAAGLLVTKNTSLVVAAAAKTSAAAGLTMCKAIVTTPMVIAGASVQCVAFLVGGTVVVMEVLRVVDVSVEFQSYRLDWLH